MSFLTKDQHESDYKTLIDKVLQGDQISARNLYDRFSSAMYQVCLHIIRNEVEAADALQESFVKVFLHLDSLENEKLLPAWIKRITVNTCVAMVQKSARYRMEPWEDQISHPVESDDSVGDLEAAYKADLQDVNSCILQLPERYRLVFTLYVIENYSHDQISEMLGIAPSTSRSQYLRAKIKLIQLLKNNNKNERSIQGIFPRTIAAI